MHTEGCLAEVGKEATEMGELQTGHQDRQPHGAGLGASVTAPLPLPSSSATALFPLKARCLLSSLLFLPDQEAAYGGLAAGLVRAAPPGPSTEGIALECCLGHVYTPPMTIQPPFP